MKRDANARRRAKPGGKLSSGQNLSDCGRRAGMLARRSSRRPKTLDRILHAAGKLVRSGRRRRLKIPATWPWADAIATAWTRVTALPQAP